LARPLDIQRLPRATTALQPQFPDLPAVTPEAVRQALGRLGGFVAATGPELDRRWSLYHTQVGPWFMDLCGTPALRSALREALVPLGAAPDLDDPASLVAWAERALGGELEFNNLPAQERLALGERLLDGLPDGHRPLPELARFAHRRARLLTDQAWLLRETGGKGAA